MVFRSRSPNASASATPHPARHRHREVGSVWRYGSRRAARRFLHGGAGEGDPFSGRAVFARFRPPSIPGHATHDLCQHHRRDAWKRRPRPAEPPAGLERAVEPADRGPEPGARSLRGGSGDRRDRADRVRKGLRRWGRHQGDAGQKFCRRFPRRLRLALGECLQNPQARHRRGGGLRPRRRLRARDDVRLHPRRRHRQIRPAGDQARRDAGGGRHAAAHPVRRQVEGDGDDF